MRGTTVENQEIATALPFDFAPEEFKLGNWGNIDFYAKHEGILIFLEVEKGQKHPNTNVLKVWPYLEENLEQKVILIQIFRKENKAPKNRLMLCKFTGQKLRSIFPGRFEYIYDNWHPLTLTELISRIENKIELLK